MDKIFFVYSFDIKEQKTLSKEFYKLDMQLCNSQGESCLFSSALMEKQNFEDYKSSVLKVLDAQNKLDAIYKPLPLFFNCVTDSEQTNKVLALEGNNAIITKNEVKFY